MATIIAAFISGGIVYWLYLKKRYRDKADNFKEILLLDIESYESDETTISAVVLSLFPKQNLEFRKLLIYMPKKKQKKIVDLWEEYEDIYTSFNKFGIFGPIMAEAPHPDFETTPETLDAVARKRKKKVLEILRALLEKL